MKSRKHLLRSALTAGLLLASAGSALAAGPNVGAPVPGGGHAAMTATGDRWAVVSRTANLARGKGVVAVTRGDTATGSYIVAFNRDVTRCVYVATVGLPGTVGVETPGQITVVRRFNNPRAVYIETHDSAGNLSDRGFHLLVGCG